MDITWKNIDEVYLKVTHEQRLEFYESTTPQDYYFATIEIDGEVMVGIVGKDYFEMYDTLFDQSIYLDHIIPDYLFESMESIWSTVDFSREEVAEDLKDLGFTENKQLQTCIESLLGC